LLVTPPEGGTTVFVESSGATSVKTILALIRGTEDKLETLKVFVNDKVAKDLEAERTRSDQKFADIDDQFGTVEDDIAAALVTVGENAQKAKSDSQQYTNQAISQTVTPAVNKIKQDMAALETKINEDVGKKVEEVSKAVDKIMKTLLGTSSAMAADNCAAIKSAQSQVSDDYFWIKNAGTVVEVFCKLVNGNFVSMGGDGSSKAAASAGCEGHDLVANNGADKKWIDPDANAENTGNAVQKVCSYMTCKEIKEKTGTTTSGKYKIKPKGWTSGAFEVWCDMTRDGGGWTFTEMHSEGYSNRPIGRNMPDKGANEDLLLSRGDDFGKYRGGNQGDYASLGERKIMAIYHSFGEATIMRNWNEGKYFSNHGTPVNFYYQKKQPKKDWSIFHAIRNTKLWSGRVYSRRAWASASDGYKMTWKDSQGGFATETSYYDPKANQIRNERNSRGYMLYWEEHTITGNSGKSFRTSRHGIPGDPFGGCQWNFYFYGGNGRRSYGHCGRMKKSFYWLR
jgi:hypothetical protein